MVPLSFDVFFWVLLGWADNRPSLTSTRNALFPRRAGVEMNEAASRGKISQPGDWWGFMTRKEWLIFRVFFPIVTRMVMSFFSQPCRIVGLLNSNHSLRSLLCPTSVRTHNPRSSSNVLLIIPLLLFHRAQLPPCSLQKGHPDRLVSLPTMRWILRCVVLVAMLAPARSLSAPIGPSDSYEPPNQYIPSLAPNAIAQNSVNKAYGHCLRTWFRVSRFFV